MIQIPHALSGLNALQTTDRGIVFVDCTSPYRSDIVYPPIYDPITGESREYKPERLPTNDKMAYVVISKEYGQITLHKAESLSYDFYEDYVQEWHNYNGKVDGYNTRLRGRTVICDYSEYEKLKRMYNELELQRKILGDYWEPLGIVATVEIYW